jgi:16S rRNA (adenine1518-N6/adenine1519-N6)-dimethyltransferase
MDLPLDHPPLDIPGLLRQHGLHPDKRLGQNFLIDPASLPKVITAADLEPDDAVLEIGAGLGNLTRCLAGLVRQVTAVEIDGRLIPLLVQVLQPFENVRVVQGDILALAPAQLFQPALEDRYQVVANIPYYITSAVIRHLLEASLPPKRICLTIQLEVAERICAASGDLSLLALSVQVYGSPRIAARIPAGAFYPSPKVDSAVVRIDLFAQPAIPHSQINTFFRLAKAGFSQKRKTLRNALSMGMMGSGAPKPSAWLSGRLSRRLCNPRYQAFSKVSFSAARSLKEPWDASKMPILIVIRLAINSTLPRSFNG